MVTLKGEDILLIQKNKKIYALQNNCTHRNCPLSTFDKLGEKTITCRCHFAKFVLASGKVVRKGAIGFLGDTTDPPVYKVKVKEKIIFVTI